MSLTLKINERVFRPFFDHGGSLYFEELASNRQFAVSFDRHNNLVSDEIFKLLNSIHPQERLKLHAHHRSLRKAVGDKEDEDDSDEEAEPDYYPEDNDYISEFDPYKDKPDGFFGTEHVDMSSEEVHFTATSPDYDISTRKDPENDVITLYETLVYKDNSIRFKTTLTGTVGMFRLIWYMDDNKFIFRPTGNPEKTFNLAWTDDVLKFVPLGSA